MLKLVPILLVAAGGAAGAVARYVVGLLIAKRLGTEFPWATLFINVSGCFVIGFFLTLANEKLVVAESWKFLFPIGFVGAYTTFSTYEYETWRLVELGKIARAAIYVGVSTAAGFLAVLLAAWAVRRFA